MRLVKPAKRPPGSKPCLLCFAEVVVRRGSEGVPPRTEAANRRIDLNEIPVPLLKPAEFGDLSLRFPQGRLISKAFRVGLAVDFVGQPQVRTVPRIIGSGTTAAGLSASPD